MKAIMIFQCLAIKGWVGLQLLFKEIFTNKILMHTHSDQILWMKILLEQIKNM